MKFLAQFLLSLPAYVQAAVAAPRAGGVYCTFFSEKDCKGDNSVAFYVNNNGCFSANGKSVDCQSFKISALNPRLIQSPVSNDQNCYCQSHCSHLNLRLKTCWNLEDEGFNMDYNTYSFINDGGGCDSDNC